jgi:hypothetical protein
MSQGIDDATGESARYRDWLEGLSTTQFATAAFYVDLLAEQGPRLSEPYTRQLEGSCGSCGSTWVVRQCGDLLDCLRAAHRAADDVRQDPDATHPGH